MSAPKSDRAFFDAIARRYDRVYAETGASSKAGLATVVSLLAGKPRVLVLGVGTGRELSALLDAGHVPTGLDFSTEMLALCGKRTRPVPLVQADFWEPLPFPDGSFDAAVALHGTLGHPPEDERSLAALAGELLRVLSRPGLCIFEVPTRGMADLIPTRLELADGRRMTREGARLLHEDTVANVSIEARLLPAETYADAFTRAGFVASITMQPDMVARLACALACASGRRLS